MKLTMLFVDMLKMCFLSSALSPCYMHIKEAAKELEGQDGQTMFLVCAEGVQESVCPWHNVG